MKYQVELKRSARKEMDKLSPEIHHQVAQEILKLEDEPRPKGRVVVLKPPLEGYRIRVGDWRVLYNIDDAAKKIFIFAVRHRREAYRKRK